MSRAGLEPTVNNVRTVYSRLPYQLDVPTLNNANRNRTGILCVKGKCINRYTIASLLSLLF